MNISFVAFPAHPTVPSCLDTSPERLDLMSAHELIDAMGEAIDLMAKGTYDATVIDAYLEALGRKSPVPAPPNAQVAYANFLNRLAALTAEGE